MHVFERDDAAGRLRQGDGVCGRGDGGRLLQQFRQPLGRAGRLREFAPDFRKRAEAAGGKDRIEQELPQRARRQGAREHILCAEPEHGDDAAEDHGDGKACQQGPRPDRRAGG